MCYGSDLSLKGNRTVLLNNEIYECQHWLGIKITFFWKYFLLAAPFKVNIDKIMEVYTTLII